MQYAHSHYSRLLQLTDLLSAGCDPEFDFTTEELEREFQELRLMLPGDPSGVAA